MSKSIDNGGTAFPHIVPNEVQDVLYGMSMRDYFAAKALEGLLSNPGGPVQANGMSGWGYVNTKPEHLACMCYGLADAMIEERRPKNNATSAVENDTIDDAG